MARKVIVCLITLALVVTMLAGCGTQNAANEDTAKSKVKDSVVIGVSADMASMYQMTSASGTDSFMFNNIYDPLIELNKSGEYVPGLAESWNISKDGLTYTFNLRKGVKFHNGEELKASDVVFTFNSAKTSAYTQSLVDIIKDITATDDYTVKINLKSAYAPFLLSVYQILIVNEKAVKEAGDKFAQNPVGTGPYKFVKHEVGQRVVMVRNDEYYKGPAPIKNLEFKVITDSNSIVIALQSGEIDFLRYLPMNSMKSIKNDPKISTTEFDSLVLNFVLLNLGKKPFDNIFVRQAFNYAIDKDAIIQIAEEGLGSKAQSIFGKLTFGYSPNVKGYDFNIEKAKELLTKAGYPNGFEVTLKTFDQGSTKKCAEVIQESLRKIGVTVKIDIMEKNSCIADLMKGNYQLSNLNMSLERDADYWQMMYASNGPMNFVKYKNPKVDELFNKAKISIDKNERLAAYEQLAQLISDDAPIVPLYHSLGVHAFKKDLKVDFIDPNGNVWVRDMSWKK